MKTILIIASEDITNSYSGLVTLDGYMVTQSDVSEASKIAGMPLGNVLSGEIITVLCEGMVEKAEWSWVLSSPIPQTTPPTTQEIYLSAGALAQSPPAATDKYSLMVGFPIKQTGTTSSIINFTLSQITYL